MKANEYFKQNLIQLRQGITHPARAKWEDGTVANKTSIYQVFEKYDKDELPIHTYRETAIKSAIQEMLWIYKDQSVLLQTAHLRGINWWDSFNIGNPIKHIGYCYGKTVADYELIDNLLKEMEVNPFSQRHILSLWQDEYNKLQFSKGGLVPCAFLTQYTILQLDSKRLVNMHLQIRSSEYVTAGAINRIQYYCLGLMICGHLTHVTGILHELNEFSVFTMDLHIYDRHEFAIDVLVANPPVKEPYKINLNGIKNFYDYDI